MNTRVLVGVVVTVLALAGAVWFFFAPRTAVGPRSPAAPEAQDVGALDVPMTAASLYFLGDDGRLYGVEAEVPLEDGERRIRALVEALLAGPGDGQGPLTSPLPGARLEGVYFLDDGAVALDLRTTPTESSNAAQPGASADTTPPGGTLTASRGASALVGLGATEELLVVYSLVNTVALGSEAAERVVLLVDGRQPATLAGHVDLTRPLRPDPSWISERPRAAG